MGLVRVSVVSFFLALALAPNAFAGSAISPQAGATVTTSEPTFVIDLKAGDGYPQIQVATSPRLSLVGLADGRVGLCIPDTPAGGSGRTSCTVYTDLPDGKYYWVLLYQRNDKCQTIGGKRVCLPTAPRHDADPLHRGDRLLAHPEATSDTGPDSHADTDADADTDTNASPAARADPRPRRHVADRHAGPARHGRPVRIRDDGGRAVRERRRRRPLRHDRARRPAARTTTTPTASPTTSRRPAPPRTRPSPTTPRAASGRPSRTARARTRCRTSTSSTSTTPICSG